MSELSGLMRIVACLALVVASAALRVAEDVALPQSSALDIDGDSDVDVLAVLRSADPGVAKLVRSAGPVRPMRMRAQARAARLPVPRMDNSSRARHRREPAVPLNHPNCWWRAGGCFLKEGHGVEIPRNG